MERWREMEKKGGGFIFGRRDGFAGVKNAD